MPTTVSYPGVYVEEIPSGVRTITGVATSVTAFVGRTLRGPTGQAVEINSFGDFERIFGGLWLKSSLSYAVRDFYLNGGSKAIIVRLYHSAAVEAAQAVAAAVNAAGDVGAAKTAATTTAATFTNDPEKTAAGKVSTAVQGAADLNGAKTSATNAANATQVERARLTAGGATLVAAYPGRWGANLRVKVDKDNISGDVATAMGVAVGDLFNLTVRDAGPNGVTEKFLNLTVRESARRVDRVLASESKLARWEGTLDPNNPPNIAAASDAASVAEDKLATDKKNFADQATITADEQAVAAAQKSLLDTVSDGGDLAFGDFLPANSETLKTGLHALEQADLFNLLCIPPYKATNAVPNQDVDINLVATASAYCEKRRAMLIVDPPSAWRDKSAARTAFLDPSDKIGTRSRNAALYFPRLLEANPLRDNQIEEFTPCGAVAGLMARTDAARGVWKAPAGTDATLVGVQGLSVMLTDAENGDLNPLGINAIRAFPIFGSIVWGARTLRGADQLADEYKYVPVRRLALYVEESLYRGLKWVVFEPNDEPLWAQIRLNVGAFMNNLFRQGAFQGTTPREAYFVKCDKETTTQNDINLGVVNIVVGFAPLKPAEFVIIKLQQMAGQIES
ncbi:MAG TPA: phage tail sheath C-terminal domain-containing protein [Pyrinomonadaceae bacterium]|nr:phage tail sheath C-terminal domain-containing protein [Pyrinomonadaceae bacterium]